MCVQCQRILLSIFEKKDFIKFTLNLLCLNCLWLLFVYSPNGRFLVQETFPKTLPRFVLILIYRSTERQRNQAFCVTAADWSTITLHDSASKQRWFDYYNQHESAVLIGLFHAASLVLPPVESYRNFQKPSQRGVQGYLSSLQRRVLFV